jgi:flagellar protein FliL
MATEAPAADAAAPKKSKKKLFIIVGVVLALALAGGGGALFFLKKKQAAEGEGEDSHAAPAAAAGRRDLKAKPVFLPLDQFTVNLADRDADRYAQLNIVFELTDDKSADVVKNFMPIIRNNILMLLSHKTAADLFEKSGKQTLSNEILVETAKALGLDAPQTALKALGRLPKPVIGEDGEPIPVRVNPANASPVISVNFSNFIIQ